METKTIKINVDERIIKSLKMYLDLKSAYGTFKGVEDEFCCRIVGALRRKKGKEPFSYPIRNEGLSGGTDEITNT